MHRPNQPLVFRITGLEVQARVVRGWVELADRDGADVESGG
jgi:hypothetical protein